MNKNNILIKITASILLFTFSYSQLLFAADVRQMLLDAKAFFAEEDAQRPHGMAASDLQAAQTQQQAAVDQQQLLQDFQNTTFNLTTPNGDVLKYVGDKLSEVERPDGTQLAKIVTDAQGNIQNADLKLSDGSIQVLENGKVIGYQTPDGGQALYDATGAVWKVISKNGVESLYTYIKDAAGKVLETIVDNPTTQAKYDANQKIKEATRKSDNQKIYYAGGVIQRIVNGDGSQVLFNSAVVNGDTVVTPQGAASDVYTDAQGNKFNFTSGSVSKITLTDNSTVDNITWDAANKIDGATLTEADGSKYIYQLKKLTRSYDPAGVVTNFTYTATAITAAKAGNTWEYLADGTPVKYTTLTGDVTTYLQSGTYKGFKNTETVAGILYTYLYAGSGATITVQKKRVDSVLLPNSLYLTSARSLRAWDGQPAWYSYEQPYGKDYLQTHWADQWVEYAVTMSQAGDLKISLQATDSGGLPAGYTAFSLQFSVDGSLKGTMSVPAAANNVWKDGSLTLTGLSQGNHTIRLKFANFLNSGGQQTDIKFRNIAFTRVTTTVTSVAGGYQATALTGRVNTIINSSIVKPAAPSSVNATDFTSITYDAAANLKQVLFKDGSKLIFDQGNLKQAYDAAGKLTSFNFEQSGLSNIVGASIVQSNLTSTYSADGKLASVKTGDLTIHYKSDGTTVEWIEKTDGTELWDLVFDVNGNLTDALIVSPDGEERTYVAGKLTSLHRPDLTDLFYANNKVTQMVTPEKLLYNFDYTNPAIIQATLVGAPPVDTLTPIKMEYDTNFNLKKVIRQNQEILNYLNTDLVQIDAPQSVSKVFNYTKDAAGKILSYTVTQGNVLTYYDANNQPIRAVISPDASNPNTLDITYQYGKIRQVKKNNVLTFTYSYSFEASGAELTVVEDLEENTQKTYRDSNLASTLDKATNVLSSYEYTSSKVSKVTVTRFGRLLHTYGYSYSGTDTVVQDEAGVVRTYNASQKLIFLEKNGEKFGYTYSTQEVTTPGVTTTTETLLPNTLYQTSARSLLSWNNGPAWFSYEQPYGNDYLQTHWADQWVEYAVNMTQAGDLKIALQASDSNGLPTGYTAFSLQASLDGVLNGTMSVPAAANNIWKDGSLTLTGLSQGNHTIRLKFSNFLNSGGQQTDFKFRNISFKQVVTSSTTTTTTQEIVGEDLIEKKLSDGSVASYSNGAMDHITLSDGTVLSGIVALASDPSQPGTTILNKTLSDGSVLEYVNGELTKLTSAAGEVTTYTYQKNAAGAVQTITFSMAGIKMIYSSSDKKLQSVLAGTEIFTVTHNTNAQGVFTGYTLTAPSGSYTFAAGSEISFYASYISKQHGSSVSEILVPASSAEIAPTYFGTGLDGVMTISGTVSLARDMNFTNLTIDTGAVLNTNGYKVYVNGNFVNRGTISAKGGDGGAGANGNVTGTPPGGPAGAVVYAAGTLWPGAAGVTGDIGRTWGISGYQGGAPGISVSPSLGGSGGIGGSGGGRADGQAGNGPYGAGVALDPLFALTPSIFNSTQLNTVYGGASGSSGAGGGGQAVAPANSKGGAGGGSGAGGGVIYISAKNFDNSQGVISADGGKGGKGGDGFGVEAGAGGGGAGGGGGAVILVSNNIQKGIISVAGGQGGDHGIPSGGTSGSSGNSGQPGSVYLYRNDPAQGQIKISTLVPYWDAVLTAIYQAKSAVIVEASDGSIVTQNGYTASGALETQKKADGSTMLFQNEKPAMLLDKGGSVLVQYTYDASGNPTRVYLKNARDALADQITKIRLNIETQRSNTLHDLAQQNSLAYQSIQTQFQDVINTINGAILSEQARRAALVTELQGLSGGTTVNAAKAAAKRLEIDSVDQNIRLLQANLSSVQSQEADAYSNLSSQVGTVSDQLEADTVRAMNELAVQRATLEKQILREEVAPVVYDLYRRILGRDPGTAEYDSWINKIDYASGNTTAEVKTTVGVNLTTDILNYLNALPELAERQTYVAAIKQAVTAQINSYLAMTQTQKEVFAATLGLTPQDIVPVSSTDATKILNWINTRSLHFGQSAFLALESLLDQKGKVYTRETLAKQAILIDILSGVISPLDDGDLVISVYALNKTGKLYGVDLNGARLSWDDLKGLVPSTVTASSNRVIAHINGNHFIIITAMTDTTITYIDPGIGKDKQNETRTISKADFLNAWSAKGGSASGGNGNVIVEQTLLNQVPNSAQKVLTKDEQKTIRGAFFPLLAAVFAAIFTAVATVVTAVVSAIAALLSTIGALVANIVSTIGGFLQGFGQALGHMGSSLFAGIKGAIGSILGALPSPVATTAGQTLTSHLTFATFGEAVFKAAITTGFSIVTSKGLQALGVNSTIAGLAATFISGGITGGFNAGFTAANFIQSGVKALALSGTQTVLQNAGMSSPLIDTLLMVASPFIDGIQTGNIGGAVVQIVNDIPKLVTNYGLQKASTALGLSPTISQLVAAPLAISLGSALQSGVIVGTDIVNAIKQSVTMGAVAYGLEFVGESHPILGSLLSSEIVKGLSLVVAKSGFFDKVLDFLGRTAINAFNVVGGAVQSVFSGITDFTQEIFNKGLVSALQADPQLFFDRSGQEAVLAKGGLQNVANLPKTAVVLPNGQQALEAKIDANHSLYYDTQGKLIGKKEMNEIEIGTYGKNSDKKIAITVGKGYTTIDGMIVETDIQNGQVMDVKVIDDQGVEVANFDPKEFGASIKIEGPAAEDPNAKFWTSVINLVYSGTSFTIGNGVAEAAEISTVTSANAIASATNKVMYALVNGIANPSTSLMIPPDYINNLEDGLIQRSSGQVSDADIISVPIYQPTFQYSSGIWPAINQGVDALKWAAEAQIPSVHMQLSEIVKAWLSTQLLSDETRPVVGMGYSGGFMPLVEAISQRGFNFESLVALGAATVSLTQDTFSAVLQLFQSINEVSFSGIMEGLQKLGAPGQKISEIIGYVQNNLIDQAFQLAKDAAAATIRSITWVPSLLPSLTGTAVQQIINVWGTNDILYQTGIAGKRENLAGVFTYNIEIAGASHFDYMLRSDEKDPLKADFNRRVSEFVTDLTLASDNDAKLIAFLEREMGAPDSNGIWRFNP